MKSTGKSQVTSDPKPNQETLSSSALSMKPNGKSVASSEIVIKPNGKAIASCAIPISRSSSAHGVHVMFFRDVTLGPHEEELRFRLIHFWEARNPNTKTLIGVEMLLIDEQETVIQGFIPAGRVETYMSHLKAGSVYRLTKFYGSRSKVQFSVADHSVTISLSWNSVLSVFEDSPVPFHEDRFRFRNHEEFQENCDLRGDLYDYLGHMKLVNGQTLIDCSILDEVDIAAKRHLLVHVQTHGGPVMKLYIWDNAAAEFCQKYKSYGRTPSAILVTTVNPKWLGGTVALTTMSSSQVFMDTDVQPTRDYLIWLGSNSDVAWKINAEIVTKPEVVTIAELFSYIKQGNTKIAWFECTATIDDVVHGSAWYYISCGLCHTKATKGHTSLMCKKCGKAEIAGVPQYMTKVSVYDKSDQAVFVILGDAGYELTGHHAAELVANYFEANENIGGDQMVPVPQALIDTIGQTHKFLVKLSKHNLQGMSQSITVSKILPPEAPEDNTSAPATAEILEPGNEGSGPSMCIGASSESVKRTTECVEPEAIKRPKSG